MLYGDHMDFSEVLSHKGKGTVRLVCKRCGVVYYRSPRGSESSKYCGNDCSGKSRRSMNDDECQEARMLYTKYNWNAGLLGKRYNVSKATVKYHIKRLDKEDKDNGKDSKY